MQSASTPQASRKPKAQAYRARSPPNLAQGPLELGAAPGPHTESVTLKRGHEGRGRRGRDTPVGASAFGRLGDDRLGAVSFSRYPA